MYAIPNFLLKNDLVPSFVIFVFRYIKLNPEIFFFFFFREIEGKGRRKRERNICHLLTHWLPLAGRPPSGGLDCNPGIYPDWNWTGDFLVHKLVLNPLSHTIKGLRMFFEGKNQGGHLPSTTCFHLMKENSTPVPKKGKEWREYF